MPSDDGNDLPLVLADLAPYGSDVILIGGWVPELYRRFGGINWRGRPSRTTELDLLVKENLPQNARPTVREILVGAGLRPSNQSSGLPAVWVDPDTDVTVVEILTPRVGPPRDQVQLIEGQGMLGAIPLEDLGLQSRHTTLLEIEVEERKFAFRVPTLGAWSVSRPLAFENRLRSATQAGRDKAAKDLTYVHDVLFAGEDVTSAIARDLAELRVSPHDAALFDKSFGIVERLCKKPDDVSIAQAADAAAERSRVPRVVALAQVRAGLDGLRDLMQSVIKA